MRNIFKHGATPCLNIDLFSVVPIDEIREKAIALGVPLPTIEKDYVIRWLLNKIYLNPFLSQNLLLKGYNCIRKAYIKNTRFSDDLDFTISKYVNERNFKELIVGICKTLTDDVGINVNIDQTRVIEKPTPRHLFQGDLERDNKSLHS